MNKAAIYARVSTYEQTVEPQIESCKRWCENNGFDYDVFAEEGISGATTSRTQLDRMMQRIRMGEYKALVIWKLDRLGRSTIHLLQLLEEFRNKNVQIAITTGNIDTSKPEGRLFFTMVAGFAELEREYIKQRVQLSMDTKKRNGIALGRPKGCKDKRPRRKSGYYLYHASKPHKGDSYYRKDERERIKREKEETEIKDRIEQQ
jgi:DNA invertase Pin-like site-specific DNA recombinase